MINTIFEKSKKGNRAYSLPKEDPSFSKLEPPQSLCRKEPLELPEISELEITRHFNQLARRNMGIDTNFYPLGSCTMKFNPRVNELAASLPGFSKSHPLAPIDLVEGNCEIIEQLIEMLCSICGMEGGTLAPNAGAQGEFVGVQMIRSYHEKRGDRGRDEILIPENAHGTNPATATMCGLKTIPLKMSKEGDIDLQGLQKAITERTAGLMMTNPNTLGIFSKNILEVAKIVHDAGGLLFYDGANLNPLLGVVRPGDMGFDVMHINLHKTFSTPHGGGGPGSGPVLCKKGLIPFLPGSGKDSIGRISTFHGNFAIYLRAYLYIKLHGFYGLRRVAEMAVLNANYLMMELSKLFTRPFDRVCMHEFVLQADRFASEGVTAFDICKRLIDYGFHPPTCYFPLLVKEALLIEPTECESLDTLKRFILAMQEICEEAKRDPQKVLGAPWNASVRRVDEVEAARHALLTG